MSIVIYGTLDQINKKGYAGAPFFIY